jgi:hypothetical protein
MSGARAPNLLYADMVGLFWLDQTSPHPAVEKLTPVDLSLLMHSHGHTLTLRAYAWGDLRLE